MPNTIDYLSILLPVLLQGMLQTLRIFFLTLAMALPLGLPLALGAMSRHRALRWAASSYIWLFRGTPLLLQLFFVYFGLPALGVTLDRFPAAVTAFVLNYAAYFAEIYRGGIQSVDRGQHEAAKASGLSRWQAMRFIIIPQTVRRVIPPVSNETITLVKDTALVAAISVPELLKSARDAVNRDANTFAYVVAAAIYLALTFLLTLLSKRLETHFSRHEARSES